MSKKESRIRRDGQAIVVQKSITAPDFQEEPMLTTPKVAVTIVPPDNTRETPKPKKERVELPAGANARQKFVYLVIVKSLPYWEYFISSRVDKETGCINFNGIKLNPTVYPEDINVLQELGDLQSYDEIIDFVNEFETDMKLVSMCFPYSEVHSIQNLTYTKKE